MTTALRPRRRLRASAAIASLAMAAGLVAGMASPAAAASTAEYVRPAPGLTETIHGSWPGNSDEELRAGLFDIVIDGDVEARAYCIDINTPIGPGTTLDEIDWATSGVANLDQVEAILKHYFPNGDGPAGFELTGSDAQKAAATQAAIWHYTDGFELTTTGGENSDTVIANYEAILAAVDDGLDGFGEPVTLDIEEPASTEGPAGEPVGPYIIHTSADSVTVTPSDGVAIVDADGEPFTGEIGDGTELWLVSDGGGTIVATAEAEVGAGQVFFTQGAQRLVLASTVVTEAEDKAPLTIVPASPTSTTTSTTESTTTTTVPITPDTTVVTVPPTEAPTTVPITPAAETGGGLPVTGSQTMVLVAVAVLLLGAGTAFGVVSRRKKLEG